MQIVKLIRAKNVLAPLCKEKLSAKLSYKLLKFISKIETEEKFFNDKVHELLDQYGEKDQNGQLIFVENGVKIKDDVYEECNKAFAELDAVEVEKPNIVFTIEELSEVKFSVEEMAALMDFIQE